MKDQDIVEILRKTLEDGRLSRGERQALKALLDDEQLDEAKRGRWRKLALQVAISGAKQVRPIAAMKWLFGVLKLLRPQNLRIPKVEAYFSPGESCRNRLIELIQGAQKRIDICVFTITDNRIADVIVAAHKRGVHVSILTDDLKAEDQGSDIHHFEKMGIPVRMDGSDKHMHHKFAIFDQKYLLTGSYNWTVSATIANEENIIVTDDHRLISAFEREFEKLWVQYRPS